MKLRIAKKVLRTYDLANRWNTPYRNRTMGRAIRRFRKRHNRNARSLKMRWRQAWPETQWGRQ